MNLADRAAQFLDLGIKEIVGTSSHPQILAWIKRTEELYPSDTPIDDSKYAWCGVFVGNMVLDDIASGGFLPKPPAYFQGAKRWEAWGTRRFIAEAQRGDVAIIKRTGGYHVAIVSGQTHKGLKVIGGNQSDSLSVVEYPFSKIVAVRRS